ncbi:hypothetical protein ABFT80_18055 [Mesorhizobium sp. SB112]|uniref:hypothetical protein n=1 Tax=Mesorhizobium sp. SB112 TaxID=3151853 RepID=UPI00326321B8
MTTAAHSGWAATIFLLFLVPPAVAQESDPVPGRTDTYNHMRGVEGANDAPKDLRPCAFSMLPMAEQLRLQRLSHAKILEVGEDQAQEWITNLSKATIAKMVAEGMCIEND